MAKKVKVKQIPSKIKEISKEETLEEEIHEAEEQQFQDFVSQGTSSGEIAPVLDTAQDTPQNLESQARRAPTQQSQESSTFTYSQSSLNETESTYRTLDQGTSINEGPPRDELSRGQAAPTLGQRRSPDGNTGINQGRTLEPQQDQQQEDRYADNKTVQTTKRRRDMM